MKSKEIKLIFFSIFILVFAFIAFNIYHNSVTSTIPDTLSIKISPISPNFDLQAIEDIKKRIRISPIFELSKPLPSPTIPLPTIFSPTASPTAIPSSTEGAVLLP